MRFVSFNYIDPFPRAGVLIGGVVICAVHAAKKLGKDFSQMSVAIQGPDGVGPVSVRMLIPGGESWISYTRDLAKPPELASST